jgi:putative membrane protein
MSCATGSLRSARQASRSDMPGERLHPASFLFIAARVVRTFLIPAAVAGVSGGGGDPALVLRIIVLVLGVPALVWGFVEYLLFRFRLDDDALVVDSGVLRRQRRVVRPQRIQNVELRQRALQRLLGVAEVRVETAGAGETEVVLAVLRRADADALRVQLLSRRAALSAAAPAAADADRHADRLVRLGSRDLLRAGATANEAGLIAAAIAGVLQFVDEPVAGAIVRLLSDGALERVLAVGAWIVIALGVAAVIAVGWLISIVGALVGYHAFTLERVGADLRKEHGLLGRVSSTIPLARVQAIRVEESLLRRPLGLAALKVSTAGRPGRESRGSTMLVPITRREQVPQLLAAVFPDLRLGEVQLRPAHPRAQRKLYVRGALYLALLGGGATLWLGSMWPLLVGAPVAAWAARAAYRARGYARAGAYVVTRAGVLNRVTWIVPARRVQGAHVTQSPIQRYQRLASVIVDTAGGGRQQPVALDLGRADAHAWAEQLAETQDARGAAGVLLPPETARDQ